MPTTVPKMGSVPMTLDVSYVPKSWLLASKVMRKSQSHVPPTLVKVAAAGLDPALPKPERLPLQFVDREHHTTHLMRVTLHRARSTGIAQSAAPAWVN